MRASASSPSQAGPIRPSVRRTGFTMAGVLYGLTTLFLAVGAVNGQNNLLFWAFGMALGGLLISGIFSGSGMMGLRLRRDPPPIGRAGEPLTLRYRIENANRLIPLYCVTFTERVNRGRGASAALSTPSVGFLGHSDARGEATIEAPSRPTRRGRLELVGVTASSSFPIGLMRKSMDFDLPGSVLVLPVRLSLREDLIPRPARRGHGGAASPKGVGHADEFFGVREYIPGDSPRLIAWRPSARGDELVVRQQGTPPPTIVWVLLDLAPEDDDLDRERAIALAGALIEMLAARGCSVGLCIEHAGVSRLPAAGGWHAHRLVTALAMLEMPGSKRESAADRPRAGARIRREHAAIVVHGRAPGAGVGATSAPAWCSHLWASELGTYLAGGATIPEALMPPPPPETFDQKRRRWIREFFMVEPVGEAAMGDHPGPSGPPRNVAEAVFGAASPGSGAPA